MDAKVLVRCRSRSLLLLRLLLLDSIELALLHLVPSVQLSLVITSLPLELLERTTDAFACLALGVVESVNELFLDIPALNLEALRQFVDRPSGRLADHRLVRSFLGLVGRLVARVDDHLRNLERETGHGCRFLGRVVTPLLVRANDRLADVAGWLLRLEAFADERMCAAAACFDDWAPADGHLVRRARAFDAVQPGFALDPYWTLA